MRKRIVIDPKFSYLKEYIFSIPENFEQCGEVIYAGRNIVRKDRVGSTDLVIKSYGRIFLPNRIRYTFFYPSKAERAFFYAFRMLEKGIATPSPVAYIECFQNGILRSSYFVSLYLDYQPLSVSAHEDQFLLMKSLARFSFRLHESGIRHLDFSVGNILFKKINGNYLFALVDNNRMQFKKISTKERIRSFERLGLPNLQLVLLAEEYAALCHLSRKRIIELMFRFSRTKQERNQLLRPFKEFFKRTFPRFVIPVRY